MQEITHKEQCAAAEWASELDRATVKTCGEKYVADRTTLLQLGAHRAFEWLENNGYKVVKFPSPGIGSDGLPMVERFFNIEWRGGISNLERMGWRVKQPEEYSGNGELILMEMEQTRFDEERRKSWRDRATNN
jgi:hypothetical protein